MADTSITRKAKGKLGNDDIEKEFDNVIQQVQEKFVRIGEKNFTYKNYTPTRSVDIKTATLGQVCNLLCTLLEELGKGKAIK